MSERIRVYAKEVFMVSRRLQGMPMNTDKNRRNTSWHLPDRNKVKLNTDRSQIAANEQAATAGVIRNEHGYWLKGVCMNLGNCSPFNAELWGLYKGLKLSWQWGSRKICVENDNLIAVNIVKRKEIIANQQWALVDAIKRLLRREWEVTMNHVYRESNGAVDWLPRQGHLSPWGLHILQQLPSKIEAHPG